jgi:Transcriptional regulator
MILPFTLQQLRIIKAISTETSFTKAAEILFISQPSLSKQVKTLEGRLGIQLITRNKIKLFYLKQVNYYFNIRKEF